jgi:LPXTG-motif cell wall-anchored protein
MSLDCRRVPSVCRRIVVLLAVALLGVGVPLTSTAFAQSGGAGDQQYSDPFGGDDSSSGSGSGSGNSSSGSDSDAAPLTQAPQTSGSGSSGSGSSGSGAAGTTQSGTSTSTTAAPAASGTLPNTGLDARVLVLAGVVLVLVGAGLRLRNAPERF